MKTASGSSFPMVSRLTAQALCRMPTTLIAVSRTVSPMMTALRPQPAAAAGQ